MKGSSLSEETLREFLTVLRRHDAIAEAVVVDVGAHGAAGREQPPRQERDAGAETTDHQMRFADHIQPLIEPSRERPPCKSVASAKLTSSI